jgi:hypothetical protein
MAKYQRKPTVIDGIQVGVAGDYGVLGNLGTTDWLMTTATGTLHTLDDTSFNSAFALTSQTATLTGTDTDAMSN